MTEMQKKLDEAHALVERVGNEYPAQAGRFMNFLRKVSEEGALDVKTKELISVALSVAAKCDWCIALHVKNALATGTTKDEIMEACFMAVSMCGGPALMYTQQVMKALDEFHK
ncbi:MAG: carboxymuconolactone decarboxylase family protein [Candidatus Altiarchaeota archaeon]|nr:carboxymuconolactone decarboxylase family protein [Candidatus Altiarchaeota archaeon]